MTTRYLTGAYPAGYQVQPGITNLDIETSASVGGSGVRAGYDTMGIDNEGSVNATGTYGMFAGGSTTVVNGKTNHGALIEGGVTGFSGGGGSAGLYNYGTIIGLGTKRTGSYRVAGVVDAFLTNGSVSDTTALIQGGYDGVFGGPVTNFGTIVGTTVFGVDATYVTNGSQADRAAYIRGAKAGVNGGHYGLLTNYGGVVGGEYGARFLSGGTIWNHGTISGDGAKGLGIALYGNSRVVNGALADPTGLIQGVAAGVYAQTDGAGRATIVNYATIEATGGGGYGVLLAQGTLTNGGASDRSALIEGAVGVSIVETVNAYLHNYGVIQGATSAGLTVSGQGVVVINGSRQDRTALITGAEASVVSGAVDTVINYGTISGLTITAANSLLEVAADSAFGTHPVTIDGALQLLNGNGTLSGLSGGAVTVSGSMATTTFNGFDILRIGRIKQRVSRNAQFTLTGSGMIAAGEYLGVYGRLTIAHDLTVAGRVGDTSTGVIDLAARAKAEFEQATTSSVTVSFQGGRSLLELADPSQFGATISGMPHHGKIDLVGIAADSAELQAGDKLVITEQGHAVATLLLSGSFGSDTFTATSDGKGGTFISVVRSKDGADPPGLGSSLAAFAGAAAALGDRSSGHAVPGSHASYARRLLAAPRIQTA